MIENISRLGAQLGTFFMGMEPAKRLLLGYLSYIAVGWLLLSLPYAQAQPVTVLDNLFTATSAVSTTGLITVDPGQSYTFFGELVLLLLIQFGGLGYMTLGSFVLLAFQQRMSRMREETTKDAFHLPKWIEPRHFIVSVVLFTLVCELVGAALLYPQFLAAGTDRPLWSAIFHSISAFCTAGFSLNANSFEDFTANFSVNATISALSLLGAMGFLIIVDGWRTLCGRKRHLGFTSKTIARITFSFLLVGTILIFLADPGIAAMATNERLMAAFFQVMTASTTVGFNTVPISGLSAAVIVVLFFLMIVGASPAGTGGGLKTTAFATLTGLVRSTLKARHTVTFFSHEISEDGVRDASASLCWYLLLLFTAMFLLLLTEPGAQFIVVMFEAVSAMGTVGLSMGLTGDLSDIGKIIIIVLMTAGRLGVLTFGIAIATREPIADIDEEEGDEELVL